MRVMATSALVWTRMTRACSCGMWRTASCAAAPKAGLPGGRRCARLSPWLPPALWWCPGTPVCERMAAPGRLLWLRRRAAARAGRACCMHPTWVLGLPGANPATLPLPGSPGPRYNLDGCPQTKDCPKNARNSQLVCKTSVGAPCPFLVGFRLSPASRCAEHAELLLRRNAALAACRWRVLCAGLLLHGHAPHALLRGHPARGAPGRPRARSAGSCCCPSSLLLP